MSNFDSDNFIAAYDDVAVEVVCDKRPNSDVALPLSNMQICSKICDIMKWESFDLFSPMNFQQVFDKNDKMECLAYSFLSFLRYRVFQQALLRDVGFAPFSTAAQVNSEYWYIKLMERYNSHVPGAPKMPYWIH